MLLLFTLIPNEKNVGKKLIFRYDTEKKESCFLNIFNKYFQQYNNLVKGTSGIEYSGEFLCFGVQLKNRNDFIYFINIYNGIKKYYECKHSRNIGNIFSIYPGKLYLDSQYTNSIDNIDFDPVNLDSSYFKIEVYYYFGREENLKIKSLYNYKSTWFIALQKKRKIIDLTNNRIVFSDIDVPCNIFFNSNHRLCFLERNNNKFHCGDDIYKIGNYPTAAIEDYNKGGYWIIDKNSQLYFINYEGSISEQIDLSIYGKQFNNIIELKGTLFT